MQISLKASFVKAHFKDKDKSSLFQIERYYMRSRLENEIGSQDGYKVDDTLSFDLTEYKPKDVKSLHTLLLANSEDIPTKTIETVNRWLEVLANPENTEVDSLQTFEKAMQVLLKKSKTKWLFMERGDGELSPVLVT